MNEHIVEEEVSIQGSIVFEETNILKKIRSNAKKIPRLSIEQYYIKQVNSKANSNHLRFSTDPSNRKNYHKIVKVNPARIHTVTDVAQRKLKQGPATSRPYPIHPLSINLRNFWNCVDDLVSFHHWPVQVVPSWLDLDEEFEELL